MASIGSLGRMVSALKASQVGLQVTGHNLSNMNTKGYTRQQALQHESTYLNYGTHNRLQQVGLGVTISEIRQIRDAFVDRRFRTEQSVLQFYTTGRNTTKEIEMILDEPHGESISGMMEAFWKQAQKLSTNPSGVEERLAFIQTADVLAKRANQIMDGFESYQRHLNEQVKDSVAKMNSLTKDIKALNDQIAKSEISGDNANDYRDQRNVLLDELAEYITIDYTETPDGRMNIKANGRDLVDGQFVTEVALEYLDNGSGFVRPIWKDTKAPIYPLNREVNSKVENDHGKLQALLIARGNKVTDRNTPWEEIAINTLKSVDVEGNSYQIPKVQKQFAELIGRIGEMVNETLNGKGLDGENGLPMFVVKDASKPLQAGNIIVNPELLSDGGYNHLGTVVGDAVDVGDNQLIVKLLEKWQAPQKWFEGEVTHPTQPKMNETSFMDYYAEFVTNIGSEGFRYQGKVGEKEIIVNNAMNERLAIGNVSQDEELTQMLKYQYAYNAASRMIHVMDGMMDTIINRM